MSKMHNINKILNFHNNTIKEKQPRRCKSSSENSSNSYADKYRRKSYSNSNLQFLKTP